MTLGEKIRYERKRCGLSQGQLAEKLCVSRSAIAKWETGKGMPDVENLKTLARLLQISVDALLDDSAAAESSVIRQPYHLASYGRGCSKVRKSRLMRERFPDANICSLLGRPELDGQEKILDSTRGFLTPNPFGMPEFLKSVRDMDRDFYLVEQPDGQYFVTVTDEFLEIHPFSGSCPGKEFRLGNWHFIRGEYLTEE